MFSLSITSCKRPDLFEKTINSLRQNCLEFGLINEVVWADDHSSEIEFSAMEATLGAAFRHSNDVKFKVLHNTSENKGLYYGLNFILDNVTNQYCLHIEDDWLFLNPKRHLFLSEAAILMSEVPEAIQVLFNKRPMFDTYWGRFSSIPYHLWQKGEANDGQIVNHPGFTLNPSLIDWRYIHKNYGYFKPVGTEGSFSEELYNDGFRTITSNETYIQHIGADISSFILNNTNR